MREGEVALLTADDFMEVSQKMNIRVKLVGNRPKNFTIADMNSKNVKQIPRNRIEYRLTDL